MNVLRLLANVFGINAGTLLSIRHSVKSPLEAHILSPECEKLRFGPGIYEFKQLPQLASGK